MYEKVFDDWIYDIECYPNVFTLAAVFANGKGMRVYEISDRRNDVEEMLHFLRNVAVNKHRMVGFNNVGYDYPLLHEILTKSKVAKEQGKPLNITAKEIWGKSQKLFEAMKFNKFGSAVRASDVMLPQVDLFKIWHFDNKAKATGLKILEFNMRSKNIEDLPFPVGTRLKSAEIDTLIEYNKHDVMETLKFYHKSMEEIKMRDTLTKQFGFDCTNFNDTKIGKELFVQRLEQAKPGICYKQSLKGNRMVREMQQTVREHIHLGDCILPYIKFERPEFEAIRKWFASQTITETNGVFSDLEEHQLGDVAKYANMRVKMKKMNCPINGAKNKRYVPTEEHIAQFMKEHPMGWVEMAPLKSPKGAASYWFCWNIAETLNVVIDGFQYDFGTGGIHGCKKGVTISKDGKRIYTLDVASYYPNLSIRNKIYPEHLDILFCDVYEGLFIERRSYDKKSPFNKALKLALNGTYGASGDEFSPMFDKKFMMSITINGQLSLCMLMEKLLKEVNAEVIMCNTDGFEFVAGEDPETKLKIEQLVTEWETMTGLEMEGALYDKMMAANVNNYIACFYGGEVKHKGAYVFEKLEWHKNQSALVVKMAASHELLGKGKAEDFIRAHDDPYDFMLRTKVPRTSSLVLVQEDGFEVDLQNICRYYPSHEGGKLVKIMPALEGKESEGPRRLGIDAKWNVTPCNNMDDFSWGINYDYYIEEAQKLIDAILGDVELSDYGDDGSDD
ncbi:putative DNA polymerase [Pseudomonas phage vB_PpS_SYP]|nr:putative DNA polymerase [Pseudomonas phage vB_PpS_SYP]